MGKKKIKHSIGKKKRPGEVKVKLKYKNISYKDGDYFEAEEIRDKRMLPDGKVEYFVKWLGWPEETNTWEPLNHLKNVKHLVYEFEEKINKEKGVNFVEPQFSLDDESEFSIGSDPEGNISSDTPMRIVRCFKDEDARVMLEIEWMVRKKDGIKPLNSTIEKDLMKKNYLLMLLDFYESRFRFPISE
jgi:hypothetical protein